MQNVFLLTWTLQKFHHFEESVDLHDLIKQKYKYLIEHIKPDFMMIMTYFKLRSLSFG